MLIACPKLAGKEAKGRTGQKPFPLNIILELGLAVRTQNSKSKKYQSIHSPLNMQVGSFLFKKKSSKLISILGSAGSRQPKSILFSQ